jgi:tetratricopeptide (TPR) repeat protein
MARRGYEVASLDAIDAHPTSAEWLPVRAHFDIQAFGVNAWKAAADDDELISAHEESSIGHEELYLVLDGRATFTVGGEEIDAPAGTIVFVRDPATERSARASQGTTILTVGAKPGEAFRISPWERNADILPLFERGEFAEAKRRLEQMVADEPEAAGFLYNLACAEAQLGEHDAALEHLARAVEMHPRFVELARDDRDFESIRADPRFPG